MSKNTTDTNQASEDELKELLETLDGPYGWRADIERLIRTEKLKARLDELRYLLEDFGIEDDTQPIQKRISELTKLEAEL